MTYRIPNTLVYTLAALFIPAALFVGLTFYDMAAHLAVGIVMMFTLLRLGGIGHGACKLYGVICMWIGPDVTLLAVFTAMLLAGCAAYGCTMKFLRCPVENVPFLPVAVPSFAIIFGSTIVGTQLVDALA